MKHVIYGSRQFGEIRLPANETPARFDERIEASASPTNLLTSYKLRPTS